MSAKYERRFFTGATEKPVNDTELRKDPDGEPSGFNPVSVFIEPLHFSASAAWALAPRDRWIGWDAMHRQKLLPFVLPTTRVQEAP